MKQCQFCGSELPEDARFCGHCGREQKSLTAIDEATSTSGPPPAPAGYASSSSLPTTPLPLNRESGQPQPGSGSWPPLSGEQQTPLSQYPNEEEEEEKRRRRILPIPPLPLEGGASSSGSVPMLQGTPGISSVPALQVGAPTLAQQAASSTSSSTAGSATSVVIGVVIVGIVVLGSIGAYATYRLTRPQPAINVTSAYKVGGTPAGSSGTVFHIDGHQFSNASAISFLLDGNILPGKQNVYSDASGNFNAALVVTGAWALGKRLLSARDASNAAPKNGIPVIIVQQGQANTPGLYGAPPDDASFTLNLSIQGVIDASGQPFSSQVTLIITGHPDPAGGTVCRSRDNGQPIVSTSATLDSGVPFKSTHTMSCSGSYKGGKISFTETLRSDVVVFSADNPPATCTLNGHHMNEQLTGSYTDQHVFRGTITYLEVPPSAYSCTDPSFYVYYYAQHGSWTGQIVA